MPGRGRLLIVGGGIGGLSASIALRAGGYEVHVVELQPDLRSSVVGIGIIQPTNALRALDAIGCAEACMEAGFPSKLWMRMYDIDGNLIQEFPGEQDERLPPMNGITRPRLHAILTERAIGAGVTIEYGRTVESLHSARDRVDVTFSDSERAAYDVVVGADGLRSVVRELVLAPIEPTYSGQSSFRVNVPRFDGIDCINVQRSEQGTAGVTPLAQDLAYAWTNFNWEDRERRLDRKESASVLHEYFEQFTGPVNRSLEYITEESDIVLRPEEYLIAPRPWHNGRVVLLGDAVHCVTPVLAQGAAQAIEDGFVLAQELGATDDVAEAFERYTDRRYDRCRLLVEGCAQLGEWTSSTDYSVPKADEMALRQRLLATVAMPV